MSSHYPSSRAEPPGPRWPARSAWTALFFLASAMAGAAPPPEERVDLVAAFENGPLSELSLLPTQDGGGFRLAAGWPDPFRASSLPVLQLLGHSDQNPSLLLTADATTDLELFLRWRLEATAGSHVSGVDLYLDNQPLDSVDLSAPKREATVQIPHDKLKPGPNQLQLRYRIEESRWRRKNRKGWRPLDPVLWEVFRVAPAAADSPSPRVDAAGRSVFLPVGRPFSIYLSLRGASELTLARLKLRGSRKARLRVSVESDVAQAGADPWERELETSRGSVRLELPGTGDRFVRLTLTALDADTARAEESRGAVLVAPEVLTTPPPVPPAPRTARRNAEKRPNIVLYLVDTLRADRLGPYGGSNSPQLDALARESVVFRNSVAQSPWTRPSVASIFTGLWPPAHGVNGKEDGLPDAALTAAEILETAGYHTTAFVANANAGTEVGLGQGFERFERCYSLSSSEVNEKVFAWLADAPEPFFLYVHTIDPHAPYDPPARFRQAEPAARPTALQRYEGEVEANDASFGALVEALRQHGLFDPTLIAFVADHGEEFGEHGEQGHGKDLHAETLNSPLVLKLPGGEEAGRVSSANVQHIDILPTLLDVIGLDPPDGLQGKSLLELMEGGHEERAVYSYLNHQGYGGASVTLGRWKLIQPRVAGFGVAPLLFDRREDPGEANDLAAEKTFLTGYLFTLLRDHELARGPRLQSEAVAIEGELEEQLKALGYIQ